MKKAWAWLKDNIWAPIVAVLAVFGAWLLWKNRTNAIASLDNAVEVRAAVRDIAAKEARAKVLEEQSDASGEEVAALRRQIAASKRRVMEIHNAEPLDDKSDADVAALFTDAGF